MQPLYVVNLLFFATLFGAQDPAPANEHKDCPLHAEHTVQKSSKKATTSAAQNAEARFNEMNARGAAAMGFDQFKTTHHFRTLADGGAIEVTVNAPQDTANLNAIRAHLRKVARDFAAGNFSAALETHGELPPGTQTMQAAKAQIAYRYEELPQGARVRIATKDAQALDAIHQFLGYQVRAHRTGDEKSQHKH